PREGAWHRTGFSSGYRARAAARPLLPAPQAAPPRNRSPRACAPPPTAGGSLAALPCLWRGPQYGWTGFLLSIVLRRPRAAGEPAHSRCEPTLRWTFGSSIGC